MGIKVAAIGLNKAVDDLAAYGEVLKTSSQITREGVQEIKQGLGNLQESIKKTTADLKEAYAVNAEVGAGTPAPAASNDDKPAAAPTSTSKPKDPFAQFNK
jgi:hypothetical protein